MSAFRPSFGRITRATRGCAFRPTRSPSPLLGDGRRSTVGRHTGDNRLPARPPGQPRGTRLSATTHRQTERDYSVYWLEENNWLTRSNDDGVSQRWRERITARTRAMRRSSPPARWRPSWQPLGRQCRPEGGPNSPPTTSPTSTTPSTAHRKRSEARLRGHALLGCSTSSTRSVPRAGNPSAGGARRHPPGHDPCDARGFRKS